MIDACVHALRVALQDRLPPALTEKRLREAEGHLRMAAAEVGEEEAVRRFGSTRRLANEIVRGHRGYGSKKPARLAFGVGLGIYLGLSVPYCWLDVVVAHNGSPDAAATAIRWVPFLVLAFYVARVVQTRRWLFLPVALWGLAALATILAHGLLLPPDFDPKYLPNARQEVATWQARAEGVAAWRRGAPSSAGGPRLYPLYSSQSVPFVPFSVSSEGSYVGFDESLHGAAATSAWRAYGPRWASEVDTRLDQAKDTLDLTLHPEKLRSRLQWRWIVTTILQGAGSIAAIFGVANACGLALGALLDRRRVRRA